MRSLWVPPDHTILRTYGCLCYPHLRPYAENKLDERTLACVFIGYHPNYKGFRCLHVECSRVYLSRSVVFDEMRFPYSKPALLPTPDKQGPVPPPSLLPLPLATLASPPMADLQIPVPPSTTSSNPLVDSQLPP